MHQNILLHTALILSSKYAFSLIFSYLNMKLFQTTENIFNNQNCHAELRPLGNNLHCRITYFEAFVYLHFICNSSFDTYMNVFVVQNRFVNFMSLIGI